MKQVCYSDVRGLIRSGDLIEFAADSLLGRLIRGRTGQPVNHTAMALWMDPRVWAHDNRQTLAPRLYVLEAISNGFRPTYLSQAVRAYGGKIYWAPMHPRWDSHRGAVVYNACQVEGTAYGYVDLVTQLWRRTPLDRTHLFCSEAAQWAFVHAGVLAADYTPTGMAKHSGCGLWPGEFQAAGVCQEHKELRVK